MAREFSAKDQPAAVGQRIAEKTTEKLAGHLDALDVWMQARPEGRKPKLSRDRLAAAAIHLCDAEGLEALSMRRLATELGVGTMSLYHYVRTKDELLSLVFDGMAGELLIPADQTLPEEWRAAVTMIASRSLAALRRHPWVIEISDDPPIGPNGTRHFDQSLQAVASFPGSFEDRLDLIMSVDEFVFGHFLFERNNYSQADADDVGSRMIDYVQGLVSGGGYPQLEAMKDGMGLAEGWRRIERHARSNGRFERNLARLLDGFERSVTA